MADLAWNAAIIRVLEEAGESLHYTEIAKRIIDGGYRTPPNVGATPAASVAATVSISLRDDGERSPFVKPQRGVYGLRAHEPSIDAQDDAEEDADELGLINSLGVFWRRDAVDWRPTQPVLRGYQTEGSAPVDFGGQVGVYLLYDGYRPLYVGRVTEPRLGRRLREHTHDRLGGRWDRFSWFGVRKVTSEGELLSPPGGFTLENLISTMEALLIEGVEPALNRRKGDGFNAVEFHQESDRK